MRSKKSSRHSDQELENLKLILDDRVTLYNVPGYIDSDPISVPHGYTRLEDVEITALWTALLSWGLRKTIINKSLELFQMMGNEPYRFVMESSDEEKEQLMHFTHRTFQPTDTAYFLHFFHNYYSENSSLESAFTGSTEDETGDAKAMLTRFHKTFFDSEWAPQRTRKHVSTPERGSACKRLNMFLRWMVRTDASKVDLGVWKAIPTSDLMIPLDVHVHRVATRLGLLQRKQADWTALEELMEILRWMDPEDPAKYDYALFGMGLMEGPLVGLNS